MSQDIRELVAAIQKIASNGQYKHDASTTTTTNYMHGGGGIFGAAGLGRELFSVRLHPEGLLQILPAIPSNITDPIVPYLTGFTDVTGSEPVAICDVPVQAGKIKNATLTAQFGRIARRTEPIQLERLGEIINRAEFTDFTLVNDMNIGEGNAFVPASGSGSIGRALNREILARLLTVGVAFEDVLGHMVFTGDPANNTASGGYEEFPGLEILVGTGKVDALTNVAVPSLDSVVRDFNFQSIEANAPDNIVNVLTYMVRTVRKTASKSRMGNVQWALVMREELFYELTAIWPVNFMTHRNLLSVTDGSEARINIDVGDAIKMREDMRNGQFLTIDSRQYPVLLDDSMPELNSDEGDAQFNSGVTEGSFASDIYFLPLTVRGGSTPVTFMEFFNWSGPGAAIDALRDIPTNDGIFWTDGGRFLWYSLATRTCLEWGSSVKPRIRLLTPHLAFRLQNIEYNPYLHTREPFNDDPYFVDGGQTTRTSYADSYSAEWD